MDEIMEPKDVAAFCKVSLQKAYEIMDHCNLINLSYSSGKKTRRVFRSELMRYLQQPRPEALEPRKPGRPKGSKNRPTPIPVTRPDGKCPRYKEVFGRKEA